MKKLFNTTEFDNMFRNFESNFIGFDEILNEAKAAVIETAKLAKYPPYNIKKIDEGKYLIEMAVAGFGKQDLEVFLDGNKLTIKGNLNEKDVKYDTIVQGIAARAFTRDFKVRNSVEISNAELLNGILKVYLDAITPEKDVVKVDIKEGKA
tara:strand:+ start:808 stop:1260 length:453 start_codon:yes stop_codon:yes gene_type:complete